MDSQAQQLRLSSYRIHQSLVEKPLSIQEFWPIWGDKKHEQDKFIWGETKEEARAFYELVKKAHNLN